FHAEDGIRDFHVTGVQTCALPICRWAAQAPPGVVYALKLGQFGSHRKKLRDAATWLPRHFERIDELGESEGPTLVQLPPRWRRNAAPLDEVLTALPRPRRWAVELRDPSWVHDETFDVLERHGIALCIHDLLADHPWELTTNWTYVRFHGPNAIEAPYRGRYGPRRLSRAADAVASWL